MNCPKCGGKTTVCGSYADCESVQRKRICKECGHLFYTAEYEVEKQDDFLELRDAYYKTKRRVEYSKDWHRQRYQRLKNLE